MEAYSKRYEEMLEKRRRAIARRELRQNAWDFLKAVSTAVGIWFAIILLGAFAMMFTVDLANDNWLKNLPDLRYWDAIILFILIRLIVVLVPFGTRPTKKD